MHLRELIRFHAAFFRGLARLALMAAIALGGAAAMAQDANDDEDPPGRVGRISYVSGPVELYDASTDKSEAATLNWPITSGMRLSTGRLGRAEVRIGSLALRIDDESELEFTRVDDEAIQLTALRGGVAMNVRNRDLLREIDLLTPRERIVIEDVGRYRIDVDRAPATTSVTAYAGQARILSGRMIFTVTSGQRGDVDSAAVTAFRLGTPVPDPFDDWVASRERLDAAPRAVQYVSPEMTGVESLDEFGAWRSVESYGPVWFPSHVPTGWVPYRYGRWGYVAPWGWTWIDDAPWGFAPFHYGRWVVVGGTWGWVPGVVVARPIYAPALVVWFGQPGVSVSIGVGAPVGWFPLGPHEVFIPGYRCSRRHVNFVNVPHVTNITNITVINPPPRYIHRDQTRTTWAPGNALFNRGPIQRVVTSPPTNWQSQVTAPRPPLEAPRGIKKRPTPVVRTPTRVAPDRAAPQAPREQLAPSTGARPTAPSVPARPVPRADDSQLRQPRPGRPEAPAARPSPPVLSAPPASPSAGVPRAVPDKRSVVPEPDDPSTRSRRPTPMPQARGESDKGGQMPERERLQPRGVPAQRVAPPAAPPVAAPATPPRAVAPASPPSAAAPAAPPRAVAPATPPRGVAPAAPPRAVAPAAPPPAAAPAAPPRAAPMPPPRAVPQPPRDAGQARGRDERGQPPDRGERGGREPNRPMQQRE